MELRRSGLREALAAGGDEGTHAKEDEEEAEQGRHRLLFDRYRVGEVGPVAEADDINVSRDRSEKQQQRHGDRDMHPEHALLRILRVCQGTEEDEQKANSAWDEGCGVRAAGVDEAEDGDEEEQNAECDGEFGQERAPS